jgi:dimethylamine/trimethylamine dehydrogenase
VRASKHDVLFEPLQVGSKTLRNRFYAVPHAYFPIGRRLSEIAFRRMKAEGGWAAVCGGIISIREDNWDGCLPRIWDEVDRGVLARMAAEVRGQGALAGIELGHNGAIYEGGKYHPSLGPTQVADPDQCHLVPKAMELDDIRRLQDDWVAAASEAADLGYDIVYAYGSGGYLPAQFLSPYFNKRTDAYGGSLENRARFWLETLERFRAAVGNRCVVAVRVAAEALSPLGVSMEDTLGFVRLADDLVDLWDVNLGFRWAPDSAPSRLAPEAYQLEWTGRVREATAKPIVGVGRLTSPDRMAEIVRSGVWDLIGAARPSIADPYLPRKIEEGRYDEIQECTGANFCIAKERFAAALSCLQNPTIGEEYRRGWHPERFAPAPNADLDVLVVGGGPGGMECARVLGHRGYRRVHLVDAGAALGGHLGWLTQLPGLGEWARIVNYRTIQLDKLANVEAILGTRLDAGDVLDYGADAVVLATGSRWLSGADEWENLPLAELRDADVPMLTPEEVAAEGRRPEGDSVVVWDRDGTTVAASLAERLAGDGYAVTLASAFDSVAPMLDATFEGGGERQRLHDLGVVMRRNLRLTGGAPGALTFADEFGDEHTIEADSLVLVVQRLSDDRIYHELRSEPERLTEAGIRLFRTGDCVAPRELGYVISDAHRLGRELDSDDPGRPRMSMREDDALSASASFGFEHLDPLAVA